MMADEDVTTEAETPAEGTRRPSGPTIDKRALLKRLVVTTGIPAPQARKLLDATLTEIATALDAGSNLSLPPLGKLRGVRTADKAGKAIHTLRLRRSPPAEQAAGTEEDEGLETKPGAKARALVKAGAAARRKTGSTPRRSRATAKAGAEAPTDEGTSDT